MSLRGAIAVAEALKRNNTLTYLGLGNNKIDTTGGLVLAEMLVTNTSLTSLDLRYTNINSAVSEALLKLFKVNHTIINLKVDSSGLKKDERKAIKKALEINKELQEKHMEEANKSDSLESSQYSKKRKEPEIEAEPQIISSSDTNPSWESKIRGKQKAQRSPEKEAIVEKKLNSIINKLDKEQLMYLQERLNAYLSSSECVEKGHFKS